MQGQASPKYAVAETFHEWGGTALYRAVSSADRRAVILKVLDPRRCRRAALDRQRREYEVGRALDLATVARPLALEMHEGMSALVLVATLENARKAGARLSRIAVGPLSGDDLTAFVAEALRASAREVAPLARLLAQKTGANPFFAIQFLTALYEERLLELDERTGRWRWDLERIRTRSFTENVVDLMLARLGRLAPDTQEALKQLASIGNGVELGILETVLGRTGPEIEAVLWEALREGLVLRIDDAYRFVHDRVREAAYSLVAEASRPAVHLRIGRLLLARLPRKELEERVFEIVNQLNRGIDLITDRGERDALRRLDLLAGRKARASGAYASARSYLRLAAALLPKEPWTACYGEALAIHLALAECEYLVGEFRRADEILDGLLASAASELDRTRVVLLRIALYQGTGRFEDAWGTGLAAVLERLEPDLARVGCSVAVRASAPVTGEWDRSRLDQVVTNLLSNALKFAPGKPIEIAVAAEDGLARLEVSDRGIGIAAARQDRIFERFERAAPPEHYGGLGLGLYISRRIVEAHGGSIRVESAPDAGARFTVELPRGGPPDVAPRPHGRST